VVWTFWPIIRHRLSAKLALDIYPAWIRGLTFTVTKRPVWDIAAKLTSNIGKRIETPILAFYGN